MLGGVSQSIQQRLSFDGRLSLKKLYASFYIDMRGSHKSTVGMNMVVEDHQSDHNAKHQQMRFFTLNLIQKLPKKID